MCFLRISRHGAVADRVVQVSMVVAPARDQVAVAVVAVRMHTKPWQ
jgi:hypothetical protein